MIEKNLPTYLEVFQNLFENWISVFAIPADRENGSLWNFMELDEFDI